MAVHLRPLRLLVVALACGCLVSTVVAQGVSEGAVGLDGEFFHHDIDSTTIAVGYRAVCALTQVGDELGGAPVCWGSNTFFSPAPSTHFIQVCAALEYACGVTQSGALECWGGPAWAGTVDGSYLQVSCGQRHACAITKQNMLRCWGDDDHKQASPPSGEFVQVSCGFDHSCAIRTDGSVACWGNAMRGGTEAPDGRFVQLSSSASHHTCGVRRGGSIACWGNGDFGTTRVPEWSDEEDGATFLQVTTTTMFSCGMTEAGKLRCWGSLRHVGAALEHEFIEISAWGNSLCGVDAEPPHGVLCFGSDVIESRPDLATAV